MPNITQRNRKSGPGGATGRLAVLGVLACALASCSADSITPFDRNAGELGDLTQCDLNLDFVIVGAAPGAIPTLDSPRFVRAHEALPDYLDPETRIIGLTMGEDRYAIPHNVLWFHEIANFTADGTDLAVTYCPLTGSSLAFSRAATGGEPFGISGLLYQNNLVMADFEGATSLWPQMIGQARCGSAKGSTLERWPVIEMQWQQWLDLYPSTWVLDGDQGFESAGVPWSYGGDSYPYGNYETSTRFFSNAMPPLDVRRHSKERVLGVPASGSDPGIAFPFGALTEGASRFSVVGFDYVGQPAWVLWDETAQGGMAFRPTTESGESIVLVATDIGFRDEETGSQWSVDGVARSGPRIGERLVPLEQAYVAFWGAWAAFHPEAVLWEA